LVEEVVEEKTEAWSPGGMLGAGIVCYVFIYNEKQIYLVSNAPPRRSVRPALATLT